MTVQELMNLLNSLYPDEPIGIQLKIFVPKKSLMNHGLLAFPTRMMINYYYR